MQCAVMSGCEIRPPGVRLLAFTDCDQRLAVSGLRSVARAGDESESILDCLDARFRPQRSGFHL